jgi:hypothetical protein
MNTTIPATALALTLLGHTAMAAGHSSTFTFDKVGGVASDASAIVGYSDETSTLYVSLADKDAIVGIDVADPANPAMLDMTMAANVSAAAEGLSVGAHQGHPMVFVSSDAGFSVYEVSNPSELVILADPDVVENGPARDVQFIPAAISPGEQPLIAVVTATGEINIFQLNQ